MALEDADGNVPLHSAVHAGDPRAVELCMAAGGQLCAQQHDQSTPLHLACAQGAIEIVRLMRSAQPSASSESLMLVDAQQMSPLHCAAMFDHDELLDVLVSNCLSSLLVQPDRQGRSVLLLAAARGAWKCVHMLLQKATLSIDQRDSIGRNLLHHIVLNGGNVHSFISLIQQVSKRSV
jgi:transient receptor potential cation channel subfamily A protein 1